MSSPEKYKKLFGEVALEMGFLNADELYEGLNEQRRRRKQGLPDKRIGQILLEMKCINTEQVSRVLDVIYPVTDA